MQYVAYYFGITLIGYLIGSALRKKSWKKPAFIGGIQIAAVTVLIFVMASRIGFNKEVFRTLDTIGLQAFVTVVAALAGSILFVTVGRRLLGIDHQGGRSRD